MGLSLICPLPRNSLLSGAHCWVLAHISKGGKAGRKRSVANLALTPPNDNQAVCAIHCCGAARWSDLGIFFSQLGVGYGAYSCIYIQITRDYPSTRGSGPTGGLIASAVELYVPGDGFLPRFCVALGRAQR